MDGERRTTRIGAGTNRLLSTEYEWPRQFANSLRQSAIDANTPVEPRHEEIGEKISDPRENQIDEEISEENRTVSIRQTRNSETRSEITQRTKRSSKSNISIDKRKIALETERKRQKLEEESRRVRFELEERQREIENSLRLLRMQEDIEKAELAEIEENYEERSETSYSLASRRGRQEDPDNSNAVTEWVNKIPHLSETSNAIFQNDEQPIRSHNDDIKLLCEAISNVVKSVAASPGKTQKDYSDKFHIRQAMERDFPYFDGNPQEWPLFYKQLRNLCTVCDYSNEEIMLKLQRHLKGEAKSVVAGMLLTAENVDLVIQTLETRFGRPEFIIETMISRIRNIPSVRDNNLEKLIQFSAEVNNMVSIIKTLQSNSYLENPQLIKELLSKLPEMLKLGWGEIVRHRKGHVNMEDFASWLGEISSAACYVSTPSKFEKFGYPRTYENKKPERVFNISESRNLCSYCEEIAHDKFCPKMKSDDIDVRWRVVTEKKLCFSCLRRRHQKFKCRNKKECGRNGCKLTHHPLLHKDRENTNQEIYKNEASACCDPETVCTVNYDRNKIILRVLPIKLYGPNGELTVLALCDEASTVTLLDTSVAVTLGLDGPSESLCLQWTHDDISMQEKSMRLNIKVSKSYNDKNTYFFLKGVRTMTNLSLPKQTVKMSDWKRFPHLKNIPIQDVEDEKPVILIGQDNIHLIVARQIRSGPEDSPVASRCLLGWSLHGPSFIKNEKPFKAHTLHICEKKSADEELQEIIKESFSTESFGVLVTPGKQSMEDSLALEQMNDTIRYTGQRYEIGLLWKNEHTILPDSEFRALQRLRCGEKKCRLNEDYAREYCQKIKAYVDKGYVRKLTPMEADIRTPRTWYLPHFAVKNPNKPNKFRLVFDAASKSNGVSLNESLLSGPDLLQSLVAILWKFRQRQFGFCGDIREMFHQVEIRKQDRCSQRFLWRDLNYDRKPDVYEMLVMTFGSTCSPVCAQFVKNYNARKFATDPEIRSAIENKFYVDDYLDSKDSEEEALQTIEEVCKVQRKAGFEVVGWMSNSQLVREKLDKESLLVESKNIDDSSCHRILGLWWKPSNDEFSFKLNFKDLENVKPTKRIVLKYVMSVFDPLGLISTLTIRGKILMQDIWRSKASWDDQLPEDLLVSWNNWIEDIKRVTEIRVPRCYSLNILRARSIEIHTFCDSSEKAFAAVSYLRVIGSERIDVSLIAAKTRVAPLKPLSIPRLELQAAVMGSRLAQTIEHELEITIDRAFFWSDSRCVLKWIRADGRNYKQFVSHRIGEIQERTRTEDWKWVPTEFNVADEATRLTSIRRDMVVSHEWFNGPHFLRKDNISWPVEDDMSSTLIEDGENELKMKEICLVITNYEHYLPNIQNFSKLMRLIRTTSWCFRFIENLKNRRRGLEKNTSELTVDELEYAEMIWIKYAQQQSFPEEISNLEKGKLLERRSKLISLCPELKNGILVLYGRINLAQCVHENTRQPIILCPKHEFTKLLIYHYHEKYLHGGVELILNEIRQKYWILKGRAAVKSVISKCLICKIRRCKAIPPLMGQLPETRLRREIRPFVNIGMDYFGPMYVKIGRRKEKRWGVIFTCFAVRAIHLELAHSLNTDSTIMAIMRMAARRGQPGTIYCDNGTNLRGAAKELQQAARNLDKTKIVDKMSSRGINFKFNPPTAAHMGGVWERLIGSVKKIIGKVLTEQSLKEETLLTFLAESEKIVNSRPLTRVSSDPADLEALTPNHFLMGSSSLDETLVSMNPNSDGLKREWKKTRELIDAFWTRWVKEYLPTLTKRSKWTNDEKPVAVDDVVILVDDQAPRYKWKLGRITATYPGPDGRIRVVNVRTANSEYRRPVTKICRLELEEN